MGRVCASCPCVSCPLYVSCSEIAVLSALGCGAFNHPTDLVAASLAKCLREPLVFGTLKRICVVIMEDHNSGGINVERFRTTLEREADTHKRLYPVSDKDAKDAKRAKHGD